MYSTNPLSKIKSQFRFWESSIGLEQPTPELLRSRWGNGFALENIIRFHIFENENYNSTIGTMEITSILTSRSIRFIHSDFRMDVAIVQYDENDDWTIKSNHHSWVIYFRDTVWQKVEHRYDKAQFSEYKATLKGRFTLLRLPAYQEPMSIQLPNPMIPCLMSNIFGKKYHA